MPAASTTRTQTTIWTAGSDSKPQKDNTGSAVVPVERRQHQRADRIRGSSGKHWERLVGFQAGVQPIDVVAGVPWSSGALVNRASVELVASAVRIGRSSLLASRVYPRRNDYSRSAHDRRHGEDFTLAGDAAFAAAWAFTLYAFDLEVADQDAIEPAPGPLPRQAFATLRTRWVVFAHYRSIYWSMG